MRNGISNPTWDGRDLLEQHDRELATSVREEHRLARAEMYCFLAVVAFIIVRQMWFA